MVTKKRIIKLLSPYFSHFLNFPNEALKVDLYVQTICGTMQVTQSKGVGCCRQLRDIGVTGKKRKEVQSINTRKII